MVEEWRPVEDWVGEYEVSNLGRVRSVPRQIFVAAGGGNGAHYRKSGGLILKATSVAGNYLAVTLSRSGLRVCRLVHNLVCIAFHGPRPSGHEAAHADGVRTNNRADNLRWATPLDNTHDKFDHGTMTMGEEHPNALLAEADVVNIRKLLKRKGLTEIGKMYGVSKHCIYDIKVGKSWKHVTD